MTVQEELELTEAVEELERTENMTEEEVEAEAKETYGSRAAELDWIMERLSELSARDYKRFMIAIRYQRKALAMRGSMKAGA